MRFGSKFLAGPLFDEESGAGGGGSKEEQPLTQAVVAQMLADNTAKVLAEFQKKQDDRDKVQKLADAKRQADEEAKRKAAEDEAKRKEDEQRAATGGKESQVSYELQKMQRTLDEERKKREASEAASAQKDREMAEATRITAIRGALGNYEFGKNGLESAFRYVERDIKRDEDNRLVGPNGAPLQDYLNDMFRIGGDLEHLLPTKPATGSGASANRGHGGAGVDLDSIKPGADNTAARAIVAQLTSDLMRGKS